jgi:hypothetical protein
MVDGYYFNSLMGVLFSACRYEVSSLYSYPIFYTLHIDVIGSLGEDLATPIYGEYCSAMTAVTYSSGDFWTGCRHIVSLSTVFVERGAWICGGSLG